MPRPGLLARSPPSRVVPLGRATTRLRLGARLGALVGALSGGPLGCEREVLLVLPPPALAGVRSALLAVVDETGVEVIAKPIDQPLVVTRPDSPLDARIELLLFDRPLDELRLIEGVVPAGDPVTGYRLPVAPHVYVSEVVAGETTDWVPQTAPGPQVSAFRTSRLGPSRCQSLDLETITIPGFVQFAVAVGTDGRTIVYGGDSGLYLLTDRDVRTLSTTLPPGFRPVAAGRTRSDDLVFVSDDGRVGFGVLRDAHLVVEELFSGSRTAPRPRYVDGGILEDGIEIYTLSAGGEISHVYPTGSSSVARFEPLPSDGEFGGVLRMRSGSALVGAASSSELWQTDRPLPVKSGIEGGVSALAFIPGFGALAGTGRGEILSEAQSFDALGPTGSAFPITGIGPFGDDGFLFGGAQGTVGYYRPDVGFCFDEEDRSELIPIWIIPRANDWVLLGEKLVSQSARAAFVTVP